MAHYTVYITRRAAKELSKNVAHQDNERVKEAISALAEDPRPRGCQKVRSAPAGTFRIRVGDYRVIYRVRDKEEALIVALVRRRSEDTYSRL
ncbi:MAG: type II toxin-antitoxin system RelE/ParE family toxin [Anaerolineae bacterium]